MVFVMKKYPQSMQFFFLVRKVIALLFSQPYIRKYMVFQST